MREATSVNLSVSYRVNVFSAKYENGLFHFLSLFTSEIYASNSIVHKVSAFPYGQGFHAKYSNWKKKHSKRLQLIISLTPLHFRNTRVHLHMCSVYTEPRHFLCCHNFYGFKFAYLKNDSLYHSALLILVTCTSIWVYATTFYRFLSCHIFPLNFQARISQKRLIVSLSLDDFRNRHVITEGKYETGQSLSDNNFTNNWPILKKWHVNIVRYFIHAQSISILFL